MGTKKETKPKVELIDTDSVDYETHPESTFVQLLWVLPAVLLIVLVIAHVAILASA